MSVRRSKSLPSRVYIRYNPTGELVEDSIARDSAMRRLRRSLRSLKASLKMPSGVPGKAGSQYDLTNKFHSQGLAAGGSAVLDAINRGKVHLAKFILDAGEQDVVNTRDFKGKTPLIRACYIKEEKTRAKAIDLLLSKGADVNVQDDSGRTALSYACELRCNDVVRVLVKNNVDPDIADNKGNTPLMYSATVGNDTGVEILIRSFRRLGLNVDHVNNDGLTALLIAAKNGFIECASILALEGKACISFRDREKGMNAEEWARAQGCSTPEILPFSTQAAFLNYKLPKDAGTADLDVEDMVVTSREQSGVESRKTSVVGTTRPRYSVSPSEPNKDRLSKTGKDLDLDELNKKLSQLHARTGGKASSSTLQVVEPYGNRARDKRSSLPSIKFFGMFWNQENDRLHSRGGDKDGVNLPKLEQSGRLTPEGARKARRERRRSSSKRSDLTCQPRPTSGEQMSLSPRSPRSPRSPKSVSPDTSPSGPEAERNASRHKPVVTEDAATEASASNVEFNLDSSGRTSTGSADSGEVKKGEKPRRKSSLKPEK